MKVGIRFADNDMHNVMRTFMTLFILPTFIEREQGHFITHLTSSMIVDLFNTHAWYIYKFLIEEYGYKDYRLNPDHLKHMRDYLRIREYDVYWDNKTDEYIESWEGNNNSEFYWIENNELNWS